VVKAGAQLLNDLPVKNCSGISGCRDGHDGGARPIMSANALWSSVSLLPAFKHSMATVTGREYSSHSVLQVQVRRACSGCETTSRRRTTVTLQSVAVV
jgi:hypothetical protein